MISDSILINGGYGYGYAKDYEKTTMDTVELLGLPSGIPSRRLGKFPKKVSGAAGTTLGEILIISVDFWQQSCSSFQ